MSIYDLKFIETPRLIIRPVCAGDETEVHQSIYRSLSLLEPWMPWANNSNLDITTEFIHSADKGWKNRDLEEFPMVAIHKSDNKIISATGYNEKSDPTRQLYEIGYWVDIDYQGQGLVTELVNALSRYAFEALSAVRLQINTQANNQKSLAVAKRCGYTLEATLENDRIDCKSGLPTDSFLFVCCEIIVLPPMEYKWCHTGEG